MKQTDLNQIEQSKNQVELSQLKELREYLTGELKKQQLKCSEKQILVDESEQKVAAMETENRSLNGTIRKLNAELENTKSMVGDIDGCRDTIKNLKS